VPSYVIIFTPYLNKRSSCQTGTAAYNVPVEDFIGQLTGVFNHSVRE